MFPLPLLPTVPDNLAKLKAHASLPYQNTFMKNALIRGLNLVHEVAPKVATGSHPAFRQFMDYANVVCDMVCLHIQGDEVFFKTLSQQCKSFRWVNNKNTKVVQDALTTLGRSIQGWKKDAKTYQPSRLLGGLASIEVALIDVLHKQVANFKADALPQSVSDEQLGTMIRDNMIWLATNSDISILIPFCMSHHDPKTSHHWPPVTNDAIKAMPELVKANSTIWKFAPFDAVTRHPNKKLV